MSTTSVIRIKAGDTEPLEFVLGAEGITTLDALATAVLYARKENSSSNHVDAGTCTVVLSSSRTLSFDPVGQKNGGGDAFDAAGKYRCYIKATWGDGDVTRHPGDEFVLVVVDANYE